MYACMVSATLTFVHGRLSLERLFASKRRTDPNVGYINGKVHRQKIRFRTTLLYIQWVHVCQFRLETVWRLLNKTDIAIDTFMFIEKF